MKRTALAAFVAMLVIAAVTLSGCTWFDDPVKDANARISKANESLKAFGASDERVQALAEELSAADLTSAGSKKALETTKKLRAELDAQKAALEAAKASLLAIRALKVEQKFKRYAELESKAIDTRIAIVAEGKKLYSEMDKMYVAVRDNKTNKTMTRQIAESTDAILARITELTDQAQKESQAASDFFEKQGLGGD